MSACFACQVEEEVDQEEGFVEDVVVTVEDEVAFVEAGEEEEVEVRPRIHCQTQSSIYAIGFKSPGGFGRGRGGGRGGMRGGRKVMIEPHRHEGVLL